MTVRSGFALAALFLFGTLISFAQSEKKSSRRGYLGVSIQDVSEKIQKRYKTPSDEGAYVVDVVEDGPAEKAGVLDDDVILTFNGKAVYDADDLTRFVQRTSPETRVDVVLWRDGARKTVPVTVGRQKRNRHVFAMAPGGSGHSFFSFRGSGSQGMQLISMNEQLAEYFGIPGKEGVLVSYVEKESAAEKAGLKAGDVITSVGGEKVEGPDDILDEVYDYDEGEKIDLEVFRKGTRKTVSLEIAESESPHPFYFDEFSGDGLRNSLPRIRMKMPSMPRIDIDERRMHEESLRDARIELRRALEPPEGMLEPGIHGIARVPRVTHL